MDQATAARSRSEGDRSAGVGGQIGGKPTPRNPHRSSAAMCCALATNPSDQLAALIMTLENLHAKNT